MRAVGHGEAREGRRRGGGEEGKGEDGKEGIGGRFSVVEQVISSVER